MQIPVTIIAGLAITFAGCKSQSERFDANCPAYRDMVMSAGNGARRATASFRDITESEKSALYKHCDDKYKNDAEFQAARKNVVRLD